MEVIVDEDGRVLQVLPLRQHIRREQVVQFLLGSGKHTLLGHRREASHDIVQVGGGCGQEGRLSVEIGNDVFQSHRQSHPQIIDGVGVSAEDQYLPTESSIMKGLGELLSKGIKLGIQLSLDA